MYRQTIREQLAALGLVGRHDPAVIEAWMRVEHGTLDHLDRERFRAEVQIASDCADAAGSEQNKAIVSSFGLDKVRAVEVLP